MAPFTFQQDYDHYQKPGFIGQLCRPMFPCIIVEGKAEEAMSPGTGIARKASSSGIWEFADTNAADRARATGILTYEPSRVQPTAAETLPPDNNSNVSVLFRIGAPIIIVTYGPVWGMAGEAVEQGDEIEFDPTAIPATGRPANGTQMTWVKVPATARSSKQARFEALNKAAAGGFLAVMNWGPVV